MTDINTLFQELSPEQEQAFRKWARENYEALDHIKDIWHPSVRDECNKINNELLANYEQRLADSGDDLTEPTRQQLEDKIEYIKDQLV
tara:strand:+ start:276 stop:539 length:264 start_codon:yes stop_codon:yes gene_type:complete